jgi:TatD DNase family protein
MFIDTHCHLTFPELRQDWPAIKAAMRAARVQGALVICTTLEEFDAVSGFAASESGLWASVGVHPDNEGIREPSVDDLITLSGRDKVVAIGETGLDYFRLNGRSVADMEWQRERFRTHIHAAQTVGKPLVIHTRSASNDTIAILDELGERGGHTDAACAGGVFHCFTETLEVAKAALDRGFFISFSGIVTFKNAADLREVARFVPLDRLLIETDSPYLAPAPHRGKTNSPAFVPLVAACLASEKGIDVETLAQANRENFHALFARTDAAQTLN